LQVPAGAERRVPCAGDHEDKCLVVVAEALPCVVELAIHHSVDGVVLLGPVVRERHDMISQLVSKRFITHPQLLS